MTEKNDIIEVVEDEALKCRKKVAIVFIKEIIEDHSNYANMLSTHQISDYLDEYPYSLSLERKAISRAIQTLSDYYPYIIKDPVTGRVWCDREASRHPAA